MKKGEVYRGRVEDTDFPDRGHVVLEDGTVLIKHAVPGREVEFRLTRKRGDRGEGMVLRTLKLSPLEDREPCPLDGICGGCLYSAMSYENQLGLKERQLKKLLGLTAPDRQEEAVDGSGQGVLWEGMLPSPMPEGYRNKMEYSFGDSVKNGPMTLGLHRRGSYYDIVTADCCRIVHEDFNQILRATLQYFSERDIPYYHQFRQEGWLRHLLVRRGANSREILADLVTCPAEKLQSADYGPEDCGTLLRGWQECLASLPLEGRLAGVLHTVNGSAADAVIDQGTEILAGQSWFEEQLSGLSFRITPFSFFQNNSGCAELLYRKAAEFAGSTDGRTVFDLYSGTGTIAQLVAKTAAKTVGVEIVPEAVNAARENADRNGITNCRFIAGDVLKVLEELPEAADIVILDPPREGVHPKALKRIAEQIHPERMVYISCKPSSFVRDLELLKAAGYRLERACGADMFPQTPNTELICLLTCKERFTN